MTNAPHWTSVEFFHSLRRQPESDSLDFKELPFDRHLASDLGPAVAVSEDVWKPTLLKHVLAFSNYCGDEQGYIVFGVVDPARATTPAPWPLRGMPLADNAPSIFSTLAAFDKKISGIIKSSIEGPVRVNYVVHDIPLDSGKVEKFGVMRIDRPPKVPVFLKQTVGDVTARVIYVRDGAASVPATPDQIRGLLAATEWAALIAVCAGHVFCYVVAQTLLRLVTNDALVRSLSLDALERLFLIGGPYLVAVTTNLVLLTLVLRYRRWISFERQFLLAQQVFWIACLITALYWIAEFWFVGIPRIRG